MKKIFTILTILPMLSFADQELVLKAHTRSFALNAEHQTSCLQIGGVDITDDSDITVGRNTIDAWFCKIVDENKYNSMMNYLSAGTLNPDNTLLMIVNSLSEKNVILNASLGAPEVSMPSWSAEATDATIPMGVNWWVRGAGHFNSIVHGNIHVNINVPDFGCSANNDVANFTGSGTYTAQITCAASQGRHSTNDIASACLNGSCVQAKGTIFFQ